MEETKKNFYVFTQGEPYYNSILEKELITKAETIASELANNFNEELKSAKTMSKYYNITKINSNYLRELFGKLKEENSTLKLELRNKHGDILTNDR